MIGVPADFMSAVDEAVEEATVDAVTDGDMHAVSSNAVYKLTSAHDLKIENQEDSSIKTLVTILCNEILGRELGYGTYTAAGSWMMHTSGYTCIASFSSYGSEADAERIMGQITDYVNNTLYSFICRINNREIIEIKIFQVTATLLV